jgi:hypothetical protein
MSDLERVTAAFQAMPPWARVQLRDLAEDYAKPAPHLRLMQTSGASAPRGRPRKAKQGAPASSPTSRNPVINQMRVVSDELVALFVSMDEEAQEFTLLTARSRAKSYPKERPALRLVPGEGQS